jgi:hypothetical protein
VVVAAVSASAQQQVQRLLIRMIRRPAHRHVTHHDRHVTRNDRHVTRNDQIPPEMCDMSSAHT